MKQHKWLNKYTLIFNSFEIVHPHWKKKHTHQMGLSDLKQDSRRVCLIAHIIKAWSINELHEAVDWDILIIYRCKPPSEARCHPSISRIEIFSSWWLMEDAGFLILARPRMRSNVRMASNMKHPFYYFTWVCVGARVTHKACSPPQDKFCV